jgi:signal transduction histidine kinase
VTPRQRSWLAWGLAGLTAALLVTAVLLGLVSGSVLLLPVTLSLSVVGALISARTGNLVGWLFVASGIVLGLGLAAEAYATGPHAAARPGAAWAAWAFTLLLEAGTPVVFLIPLLFPDGRPPSPRWRPAVWLAIAVGLFGMACVALSPDNFPHLHDPVTVVPASALAAAYDANQILWAVLFLVSAAAVIVRLVRSTGEERLQLKWFTYAAAVAALAFGLAVFLVPQPVIAFAVFFPLIPVAAGVAILKYRLYGIDVVISRTIVYGCLAAFITVVYAVIVAGLGAAGSGSLHAGSRPNPGLSILATAVVAVAFQPLRERVRRVANRVVYGRRATPYEALSELSGQVGGAYATDDVLPRMARILAEATGAARADVWLRAGPQLRAGACWPPGAPRPGPMALPGDGPPPPGGPPPDGGVGRLTLVRHQGEVLGALSVTKRPGEPLTPAEDKLIGDLAGQVGLVLRNVGLAEQLGERLAELRASRRRIVTAQDDQRRRIERDLHDGAQRQLATIASGLARAESLAGRDEERERALVTQLRGAARGVLESLRNLARGIYPPLLADQGLAAAVSAHAGKAPLPVVVDAGAVGRYPADVETAVYFCCVEAVQNGARHAPGATLRIRLRGSAGEVWFEAADDGPGFDRAAAPVNGGLQHMADRLAALGGSLQVDTCPGAGTTITGQIPATAATPAAPATGAAAPRPGPALPGPPAQATTRGPVASSPPEPAPA